MQNTSNTENIVKGQEEKQENTSLMELSATELLKQESANLLNQIIAEQDLNKTKDLTYLFNVNQSKKTMIRNDKLNDLMDLMTDQATARVMKHPEEMSNQELFNGIKTIQSVIAQSKEASNPEQEQTFIQINQQNTEVNMTDGPRSRESRDRVKNAVMSLLSNLEKPGGTTDSIQIDYEDKTINKE